MHAEAVQAGGVLSLTRRLEYSLSTSQRAVVFSALGMVAVAIAGGFALLGAWLVLPFAGLECAGLYFAFRWLGRHENDYEALHIKGEFLVVEKSYGGFLEYQKFSLPWVQIVLKNLGNERVGLFVRSHGKESEICSSLGDDGKKDVAVKVKSWVLNRSNLLYKLDVRGV